MKLEELHEAKINESIEFTVSHWIDFDGDKAISAVGAMNPEAPCSICDGEGENTYRAGTPDEWTEKCGMCNGTGKIEKFENEGPSMRLSNSNAADLIRSLGLEFDYVGHIPAEDLPELRRALIVALNTDAGKELEKDTEVHEPGMGATGSDGNVTSIGKKGATMIDVGRTPEQVKAYYKTLLKIVEYAMDNGYFVSWG